MDFYCFFPSLRDAERKRKVKELMGSLASQEGEWKALKKRKRKWNAPSLSSSHFPNLVELKVEKLWTLSISFFKKNKLYWLNFLVTTHILSKILSETHTVILTVLLLLLPQTQSQSQHTLKLLFITTLNNSAGFTASATCCLLQRKPARGWINLSDNTRFAYFIKHLHSKYFFPIFFFFFPITT